MSERVDFSANASVYDRRHGAIMSDDELGRPWLAAGLQVGARVLDIGAGTGRVAIPLASRGCNVVAVEPAGGMLAQLRAKTGDNKVRSVVAEGARLPFPVGHFDAVVIARLLYLTPDWRAILRDAHRVLAIGGLPDCTNGAMDRSGPSTCSISIGRFQYLRNFVGPFVGSVRAILMSDTDIRQQGARARPTGSW